MPEGKNGIPGGSIVRRAMCLYAAMRGVWRVRIGAPKAIVTRRYSDGRMLVDRWRR
jgi:hypothetical protein